MPEASGTTDILTQLSDGLVRAADQAGRSVLLVNARQRIPASGIVWSADGVVLTAAHVLEREEEITVRLPDDRETAATLVGGDPGSDLAVLRLEGVELSVPEHSPPAAVGQLVLAVARPAPGGPMTSLGVVSAVGAEWRAGSGARVGAYLRTDTTLYPGFSGGALVDVQGRVLGMNTSRFARDGGFAIPLDAARPIVETLLKQGRLRRAYLGVASQPARLPKALAQELDGREEALLIVSVEENSPAGRAGVIVGDLLIAVAGATIRTSEDLLVHLGESRIGESVPLTLVRGGHRIDVAVTLAERPA